MNASPAQVTAALDLFARRHPVHADNGQHRTTHPDPTTDHIMVQCSCGYRWRYSRAALEGKWVKHGEQPPSQYRSFTVRPAVRSDSEAYLAYPDRVPGQ